jgi:glycosyltransferase involved in cell wall biosynthesis
VAGYRITLINDPELVNTNYRAYHPMHVLSRRGHAIDHNTSRTDRIRSAVMRSDVVMIHRFVDREVLDLVRRLRDAGIAVLWDNDDDVLALPRSNPHYDAYRGRGGHAQLAGLSRMLKLADVVTTPSEALASRYRELGAADVRVLENYVRDDFVRRNIGGRDGVVVGWVAGLEHQDDYHALRLREVFHRLLEAHDELRFSNVGFRLGLPAERYTNEPEVDFLELPDRMRCFDIGIAPIVDNAFNRARSNVKLKEYSAAGVPWLASPVGAYRGLGEREGGRLVPDDRWFEALSELISRGRERRRLAKRAAKWGRAQTIGQHAERWERVIADAIAKARARACGSGVVLASSR